MIELKDVLEDGEVIVNYHLHNEYWQRNAITEKGNTDISGALEATLHRILEADGTKDDVLRIMGAKIPTEEERKELEEFDEYKVTYEESEKFIVKVVGRTFNYDYEDTKTIPESVLDFVQNWILGEL